MIVCQSEVKGVLKNVSLLNVCLLGLIPRNGCIAALMVMACIEEKTRLATVSVPESDFFSAKN